MSFNVSAYDFGAHNATRDVDFFYSRPDLHPPTFRIHMHKPSLSDQSFFFVSPKATGFVQNGPYIFDALGRLVWSGATFPGAPSVGLHVCSFRDAPHLCLWEGDNSRTSLGMGIGKILDASYRVAADVRGSNMQEPIDFHDFHTVERGTHAIVTIYRSTPYDLSRYKGNLNAQTGWIWNSGFQEINIETGKVVFEWWALDHVDPSESITPINVFDGQTRARQWDYFHINSVAKTANDDYIISGRHTNCIYRVSGKTGSILWRLGGTKSDLSADFKFGYQHDVRVWDETDSDIVLSMFNNGWDGRHDAVTDRSSGMIFRVDAVSGTARLSRSYTANITSTSQGNMAQILGSNNVLLNHGDATWLTEFTENGTLALVASIGGNAGSNYLAVRGPWEGTPQEPPSSFVYAKSVVHPLAIYASWNGATRVRHWRFYGADDGRGYRTTILGVQISGGFETRFVHHQYYPWAFAEALGPSGQSLGNSSIKQTWSPGHRLAESCSDVGCPVETYTKNMDYEQGLRPARQARVGGIGIFGAHADLPTATIEHVLAVVGAVWLLLRALRILRFNMKVIQAKTRRHNEKKRRGGYL